MSACFSWNSEKGAVLDRPYSHVQSGGLKVFRLGPMELVLILIIVLFLFGAKRLPEMGKGIGEGIKNFKKSIKGSEDSEKEKHA